MSTNVGGFTAGDYVVFSLMLLVSTGIGFYFAVVDRKKKSTEEYLLAGRSMSPYPVALSLTVSFLSAVTVLGTPAEVYVYGTMYIWTLVGYFIASVVTAEIYIPVFYNNHLSSVYQYLEMRFNRWVRMLATLIYIIQTVLYSGVVIFAPALALNAVTGFDLWAAAVSTGIICIVYSTLGGLKAVIWTDAVQMVVMVIGFVAIIIQVSLTTGGIETLWRRAEVGGRIEFWKFDTDPRIRHTFWTVVVGSTFLNIALYAVNQAQVQRYLSCRSLNAAKSSVMINYVGIFILNSLAILAGVVMYGYYANCDPISLGMVKRADQLMPYMVLEIFSHVPGMPGLFIASVYSGSLSTVSTAITGMASVTVQDFIKPNFKWEESTLTWVSRGLFVFFGFLCILFAYLTSQLGAILQAAISVLSLAGAPLVVVFTLGVLFPFANTWGALSGMLSASAAGVWVFCGKIAYPVPKHFSNALPTSTSGCDQSISAIENTTLLSFNGSTTFIETTTYKESSPLLTGTSTVLNPERPPVAELYAMSYIYLTAFGFLWGIVIGLIVSLITGGWKTRTNVEPKLIHPFFSHWIFKCFPDRFKEAMWCGVSHEKAMKKGERPAQGDINEQIRTDGV